MSDNIKMVSAADIMLQIGGLAIKYGVPVSVTRAPRGCGYSIYVGLFENMIYIPTVLRELYSYTEEAWDKTYKKIDEEIGQKVAYFEEEE